MISLKAGKKRFVVLIGRITTDSYSASIKKLADARKSDGCFAQIIPAELVAGRMHVWAALEQAVSAIEKDCGFARTLELEFLIRLFGEKQLSKAIGNGIRKSGNDNIVLVVEQRGGKTAIRKKLGEIRGLLGFIEDKKIRLGRNRKELMSFYGISEKEIETVSDSQNPFEELVVEKISFVALER